MNRGPLENHAPTGEQSKEGSEWAERLTKLTAGTLHERVGGLLGEIRDGFERLAGLLAPLESRIAALSESAAEAAAADREQSAARFDSLADDLAARLRAIGEESARSGEALAGLDERLEGLRVEARTAGERVSAQEERLARDLSEIRALVSETLAAVPSQLREEMGALRSELQALTESVPEQRARIEEALELTRRDVSSAVDDLSSVSAARDAEHKETLAAVQSTVATTDRVLHVIAERLASLESDMQVEVRSVRDDMQALANAASAREERFDEKVEAVGADFGARVTALMQAMREEAQAILAGAAAREGQAGEELASVVSSVQEDAGRLLEAVRAHADALLTAASAREERVDRRLEALASTLTASLAQWLADADRHRDLRMISLLEKLLDTYPAGKRAEVGGRMRAALSRWRRHDEAIARQEAATPILVGPPPAVPATKDAGSDASSAAATPGTARGEAGKEAEAKPRRRAAKPRRDERKAAPVRPSEPTQGPIG